MSFSLPSPAAASSSVAEGIAINTKVIEGERKDSSESQAPPQLAIRQELCLSMLEDQVCRFSLVVNAAILLRLLLHKITWDLGINKKCAKPMAKPDRNRGERVGDIRAPSSCSLGNSFKLAFALCVVQPP